MVPALTDRKSTPNRSSLWLFRQLWRACYPPRKEGRVSPFSTGVKLNIAATVLCDDDGRPKYWLATAKDGRLRGQHLCPTPAKSHDSREETDEYMRQTVNIMQKFWEHANHKDSSSTGGPTCIVWYADGQREVLDTSLVLKLSMSTAWRIQLVALQGYVTPWRLEHGVYCSSEDDLFGSCGSIRDGVARVGLNMLTKSLAMYVMDARPIEAGVEGSQQKTETTTVMTMKPHRQVPQTQLDLMRVIYVVDKEGTLWFSHAVEVRFWLSSADGEKKAGGRRNQSAVLAASQSVTLELENILRRAANRGISVKECFSYFDSSQRGFVDSTKLKNGLKKIGVGVSIEVANDLVIELGGINATYFNVYDLVSFCTRCGFGDGSLQATFPTRHWWLRKLKTSEKNRELTSRNVPPIMDDSLIRENERLVQQAQEKRSVPDTDAVQEGGIHILPRAAQTAGYRKQAKPDISIHREAISNSAWQASSRLDGTVDEKKTNELRGVFGTSSLNRLKRRDYLGKFPWNDLPRWARQASRKALRELMGQHKRLLKTIPASTKIQTLAMSAPLKLCNKTNGGINAGTFHADHCRSSRSMPNQTGLDHQEHEASSASMPSYVEWHDSHQKEKFEEDPKLHVGRGNIMTYRWVARVVSEPNYGGTVLEATEALSTSTEAMGLRNIAHQEHFLLIVMPDLFMTLGYMERWLGGLLEKNSRGRLLLIGSLGLPGTQWADGEILDAKTQADGLSTLLWELLERGELCIRPSLCVVIMGFGSGANAVLYFSNTCLVHPKLAILRNATRLLAIVNPFPVTSNSNVEDQEVKRSLERLKRILERGTHHEKLQSLIAALFSANYMQKHGRTVTLERFWMPRQGLKLPEQVRPKTAPISIKGRVRHLGVSRELEDRKLSSRNQAGVLKCLDGILQGNNLGALKNNVNVPLLLIASTQDALDPSKTVENFRASLGAEEVDSLFMLFSGNKYRRMLVYSIQAGREILQEAPARTLKIISEAIQAAQTRPNINQLSIGGNHEGRAVQEWEQPQHGADAIGNIDDRLEGLSLTLLAGSDTAKNEDSLDGVYFSTEKNNLPEITPTHCKNKNVSSEQMGAKGVSISHPTRAGDDRTERDDRPKKGRRARELDMRKERAVERKAKNTRLKKQQELDRLKKIKQQQAEQQMQERECEVMEQEHDRSRAMDKYLRCFDEWTSSVTEAKERALELTSARDLREQKLAENELARDRANQHIQRAELFRQRKLELMEQDGIDASEAGLIEGVKDVEVGGARDTCHKYLDQLQSLRDSIIKVLQVELHRRDQLATFETQYQKLDSGLRDAERLQRAYTRGGATTNILGDVSLQESKDISTSVAKQQIQLSTYQSVLKERREMWSLAVSHVQKLKNAIQNKEVELRATLKNIEDNIASLSTKARRVHAKNKSLATEKVSTEAKTKTMRIRAVLLKHEQELLQTHRGPFFDTEIWQQGAPQRVSTARLNQDLKMELESISRGVEDNIRQIKCVDETLQEGNACAEDIELNVQKLGQIARVTKERAKHIRSKTVMQELQDVLDAEQELKPPTAALLSHSRRESLAEMIRSKPSHRRSLDEKQWVALDILVNRDLYKALSMLENEELQINDEYKTELRAEDVAKILKLPSEIQLALPHMKLPAEVDAHKFLTRYTTEHGEADFLQADEQSQDHLFSSASGWAQKHGPIQTGKTKPSEDLHDVLPKGGFVTDNVIRSDECLHQAPPKQRRGLNMPSPPTPSGTTPTTNEECKSLIPTLVEAISASRDDTKSLILFDKMADVVLTETCESNGEIAVRAGEREVYRSASSLLKTQESHVHNFTVGNSPSTFPVDLKVIVNFTGCIDTRGFTRGKISVVLRRMPGCAKSVMAPAGECIGYAPHARQKLNMGDQFHQIPGTIIIQHRPRRVPLLFDIFEVEVTALGPTEHVVSVIAGQCEPCASQVEKRLVEARKLKARLKDLECELNETWEGVRLRERQYHVCNALIEDAELECVRCQNIINELCDYLRPRDRNAVIASSLQLTTSEGKGSSTTSNYSSETRSSSSTKMSPTPRSHSITMTSSTASSSEISQAERTATWQEVAAIETEHMHWGRIFTTRCQEKISVKKALHGLMELRRDGRAEKDNIEGQLQQMFIEIPAVVAAMHGPHVVAEVSREFNANKIFVKEEHGAFSDGKLPHTKILLETPSEKIRQILEREGWDALNLVEQQWVTVDQAMCPHKYVWWQQQQNEEANRKVKRGRKKRENPHRNLAIDQCRFHRDELTRILGEPFRDLNRREMYVRKLLSKFHDDPERVGLRILAAHTREHCILLGQRTRLKHHKQRTSMEKKWTALDKILNPQIWKRVKDGVPGTQNDQRPMEASGGDIIIDEEDKDWICPFSRDSLLRIWASCGNTSLATEDEKQVYNLLTTYNGPYQATAPDSASQELESGQKDKVPEATSIDIDQRLQCLQQELERVAHNSKSTMNSSVLHSVPQHYPTSTLRLELEAEIDRLLREQVQQRERKNVYLIEDYSSSEEEGQSLQREGLQQNNKKESRKRRRLKRRASRIDINIVDACKRILLDARKTPLQRDNARRITKLGPGGCPACMSNPCKIIPVVNVEDTTSRLERITDKLHFARMSNEEVVESTLPNSVRRDGITKFRRVDLIEVLIFERNQLRHLLKLHFIDQELHEANRTSKDHIESFALHGYRTFLWTKDAQVALEREHNRLVARLVATEIADDILEWMLEGWHFGQRRSQHKVVGNVPSIKKTGPIKAGVDVKAGNKLTAKETRTLQEQNEDRASMFTLPQGIDGSNWNNSTERVVKPGGVHDEEITFVERTMHFGLFCVAIMYFRAQWLLRQQRERSSEFKLGWDIDTSVPLRAQHKRNSQTSMTSTQAGYQRIKVRKEKEQAEVLADFAGFLAVEKRELDATQLLQGTYRGHIGRKAAHRWRAKRAEYSATNSLMVSAAVTIQRLLRGAWGRYRAKIIRAGIARWLAHLFDDESREFEAEILSTNTFEALKRGIGELVDDDEDGESDI